MGVPSGRLLTFNCHEAYVHLLAKLGFELEVIDGLPGRYVTAWDTRARPVPSNVRLIGPSQVGGARRYRAAIAHNLTDLLALKDLALPKILIFHVNLEARLAEEGPTFDRAELMRSISTYLDLVRGVAVGVSEDKLQSWGLRGHVIRPPIDGDDYQGYTGELPQGLRVAHQVSARRARFAWHLHEAVAARVPVKLVGHNPDLPGVEAAGSWDELRAAYRQHRFYLHTTGPQLDDGYNLALLEAMATGMPVVTTPSVSSPVVHGECGFVAEDPRELADAAARLVADLALARDLGRVARERVLAQFPVTTFREQWLAAIDAAVRRFGKHPKRR